VYADVKVLAWIKYKKTQKVSHHKMRRLLCPDKLRSQMRTQTALSLNFSRNDADAFEATSVSFETDGAIDESEDCPIAADADVFTRVNLGAALTDDDVTGTTSVTTVELYATILGVAVTTVTA
jgi:hypothetical protein